MKLTYDKDVDAAYIYLEYPIKSKEIKKTVTLNENINLDFDNKGKLMGVEILDASKIINKTTLLKAKVA